LGACPHTRKGIGVRCWQEREDGHACTLGFVLVATVFDYIRMLQLRQKGPSSLPIVGSYFQTSLNPTLDRMEKWTQYYKLPMIILWLVRHPRIILNGALTASDLLEKKSDIFSSKPHLIIMGEVINSRDEPDDSGLW
jgi:hypothetical protein